VFKGAVDKFFDVGSKLEEALGARTVDEQGRLTGMTLSTHGMQGALVGSTTLNYLASLGKGNFQKGVQSLTLKNVPVKTARAGFIPKGSVKGGAKEYNTVTKYFSKFFSPEKLVTYTNPKTGAQRQMLVKSMRVGAIATVAGILTLGYGLVKSSTDTGGIGVRDRLEESGGGVEILFRDMENDPQALEETEALWNDIKSREESWLPFGIGSVKNAKDYANDVDRRIAIRKAHSERKQALEAQGISEAQDTANFWKQYHADVEANRTLEENKRVDYYNSERLRVEQEILRARSASKNAEREADKKTMEETAAFWLEYHEKLKKLEEEERERQAKFWLDYRKQIIRMQADNRGSTLGFGLFR